MRKSIIRFSIWQTTKVVTLVYFIIALIIYVILAIVGLIQGLGAESLWALVTPFVMAVIVGVVWAFGLWLYNWLAKSIGGIEFWAIDVEGSREG